MQSWKAFLTRTSQRFLCTYYVLFKQNFLYLAFTNKHASAKNSWIFWYFSSEKCKIFSFITCSDFLFFFQKLDRCMYRLLHALSRISLSWPFNFFFLLKFFLKWHYYYHLIRNLSLLKRDCYAITFCLTMAS